ncbi:enoyl-CoA hydratase-related protein [Caballeronia sordidicola]|uniref:enoyl-CoA hydratase-related protein n=1 Tax=Caballeronia sordidicola TaxID=196367 RepID=UPI0004D03784|nr:enoyl-CoA hydratase-related protein [Caballeronia sordidicola]
MTDNSSPGTSFETIRCTVDERGVACVDLNRRDIYNAFDETMIAELTRCFVALSSRADVRVILLVSPGEVFCAGADLNWMKRASANSAAANREDAERFATMMEALHRCSKPIVARVQGGAFGGGVGLICACDIVVASEQAKFAVTEARLGILPAVIGPYLIEAVGVREARMLALTATLVDAARAMVIGLVHRVVPQEELDEHVEQTVADLLGNGPTSLMEIKNLFANLAARPINADVSALTAQTIARVRSTDEAREGFAAFFDKRPAVWSAK